MSLPLKKSCAAAALTPIVANSSVAAAHIQK
jgi:hypothetical protein